MALTSYTPDPFELEISDVETGHTKHRRKARFTELRHNDEARSCTIYLLLVPYALAADGGYGPELTGGNFTRKPDQLTADNRKLVDRTQGGKILAVRQFGQDAAWEAEVARVQADEALDGMYQGDFFLWLRDHQPLVIGQMIRDYIQQADQAGEFA